MENRVVTYGLAAYGAAEGVFKYYIQPELTAKRAWAVGAAAVIAYEIACPDGELMSEGVDRGIEKHPVLVPLAIGMIACHLANVFREDRDPVSLALSFSRSLRGHQANNIR
jgi:hypothetical protein